MIKYHDALEMVNAVSFNITVRLQSNGSSLEKFHNPGGAFNVDMQREELKSGVYLYSLMVDGKIIESKCFVIADR